MLIELPGSTLICPPTVSTPVPLTVMLPTPPAVLPASRLAAVVDPPLMLTMPTPDPLDWLVSDPGLSFQA
jgi:hypothetical protein